MGFISSYFKRFRVMKLARQAKAIAFDWEKRFQVQANGAYPLDQIRDEFITIILSYDSFDWRHLRRKHELSRERLNDLWNKLGTDQHVIHRGFQVPLYLPVLIMDFSTAMEYLFDYENEIPDAERFEIALKYTLKEIKSVPYKRGASSAKR